MPLVSFANTTVLLEEVQENPAPFFRELERAKVTPGHAMCLCHGTHRPLRLVIRRYGSLLHLAGWPDEGPLHVDPACPFHKSESQATQAGGGSVPGISLSPTGMRVKLDVALTHGPGASSQKGSTTSTGTGTSRRTASLLAFLQTLWISAGLNRWSANERTRHWGACNASILASVGDSTINGEPADRVLYVMRRFQEDQRDAINGEFETFLARIANHGGRNWRGIVVGEIAEVGATQYGRSITLRQSAKKYYCTSALIGHAEKKFSHAFRALADGGARVVALLLVERTAKGHHVVVDMAAMLCSWVYIPCDSIHEVRMANRLVRERRAFDKPMRIGEGELLLPDFVLTDTSQPTHVEVYGMNNLPDYVSRKEEKRRLRHSQGIPAVEWDIDRCSVEAVALPSADRSPVVVEAHLTSPTARHAESN